MRTCEACSRDFTARGWIMTCPYCGYNNTRSNNPRSLASLKAIELRQRQREKLQRQAREESYD